MQPQVARSSALGGQHGTLGVPRSAASIRLNALRLTRCRQDAQHSPEHHRRHQDPAVLRVRRGCLLGRRAPGRPRLRRSYRIMLSRQPHQGSRPARPARSALSPVLGRATQRHRRPAAISTPPSAAASCCAGRDRLAAWRRAPAHAPLPHSRTLPKRRRLSELAGGCKRGGGGVEWRGWWWCGHSKNEFPAALLLSNLGYS
jgi:hypothetical protein